MPINSFTAINRVRVSIGELRRAFSLSDCEKRHAKLIGYCQALLDCGVISHAQWQQLTQLADAELSAWMPAPDFGTRLPGWTTGDYG
ncbi:hypothetical protein TRP66_18740 [Pseudomonas sp. JDS28PS106]|uniref:hypothetical protein n=1 Tax=Pseudomonas sp. JDS28PS106 TaxID=2497235 RepID=UPI002FD48207